MQIPIRPSEAAALADIVVQELEESSVSDATRTRVAARLSGGGLSGLQPYPGSLTADPVHNAVWYVAADAIEGGQSTPLMIRLALEPHSDEVFRDATPIGRMRLSDGREVIVDAVPFGPADHDNIALFIERVDPAFRPRPHGAGPALVVIGGDSPNGLAPVFDAYRTVLRRTGWNAAAVAYTGAPDEGSSADRWHATVWAAIRAGWRDGYSFEAHHIAVSETDSVEEQIRGTSGYTKYRLDMSPLLDYRSDHRTKHGWSEPDVERLYEHGIAPELRAWLEAEYSRVFDSGAVRHTFAPHEIRRLAVKFARSLLGVERLYDAIAEMEAGRDFDYEPSLVRAETITRPKELTFCLHWLKTRGRPAQSVAPNLAFEPGRPYPETTEQQLEYMHGRGWDEIAEYTGVVYPGKPLEELAHRIGELAAVAEHFGATLTVEAAGGKQSAVLQLIGRTTGGRASVAVSEGDLVRVAESLRS
jgi:hypothetical protein